MRIAVFALTLAGCLAAAWAAGNIAPINPLDNIVIEAAGEWDQGPMFQCPGIEPFTCPNGYTETVEEGDRKRAELLLFKVWERRIIPELLACKADCGRAKGVACAVNGKSLAAYPYVTDMTVCVPEKTVKGARTIMFTQGIMSYACTGASRCTTIPVLNRRSCAHVRIAMTGVAGAYIASETRDLTDPGFGAGGGWTLPTVSYVPSGGNVKQLGYVRARPDATIPHLDCTQLAKQVGMKLSARSNWGTQKDDATIGAALLDQFFLKVELAKLRRDNSRYGCPFGAVYADGKDTPFFGRVGAAQAVAQAEADPTKHTSTSTCFTNPTAKGAKAYVYAQGIINYYCRKSNNSIDYSTKLHMGVYSVTGTFSQPSKSP